MKAIVIGSGIGGLSVALRMANLGFEVLVFDANEGPGGKITSKQLGKYRFDTGPSVLTEPELLDDLLVNSNQAPLEYKVLDESCRYFFSDGSRIVLGTGEEKVSEVFIHKLGENPNKVKKYLRKIKSNYTKLKPVFIEVSLHRLRHLVNHYFIRALSGVFGYGLFQTMHEYHGKTFKNKNTIQLLNRFATYNGSSPYEAPGLLNIIGHLELNVGPVMPIKGMADITHRIYAACLEKGVQFEFKSKVESILVQNKKAVGVLANKKKYLADIVVSNMDVHFTYERLLSHQKPPKKILNQEKSSSAIVFYWGINTSFPELGVHNILFSEDYAKEFKFLFEDKRLGEDLTVYIHITSKEIKSDAPDGCENWFVMVNAPIIEKQDWNKEIERVRDLVITRINRELKTDINKHIEVEDYMDPNIIEKKYFGKQGSIYGNSSNSKYAAFYRHPNFSSKIKGLYFTGVTVHPGGGIPLALNASKIVERCIREDYKLP